MNLSFHGQCSLVNTTGAVENIFFQASFIVAPLRFRYDVPK